MSYDLKELLRRPVTFTERLRVIALKQELTEDMWAHRGRTVDANVGKAGGLEAVIIRMALREGISTKDIADAVRTYIVTGTLP